MLLGNEVQVVLPTRTAILRSTSASDHRIFSFAPRGGWVPTRGIWKKKICTVQTYVVGIAKSTRCAVGRNYMAEFFFRRLSISKLLMPNHQMPLCLLDFGTVSVIIISVLCRFRHWHCRNKWTSRLSVVWTIQIRVWTGTRGDDRVEGSRRWISMDRGSRHDR